MRKLKWLLLNTFLMAFGSFMVTPFIAVFLRQGLGMSIRLTGLLVAATTFVQFGGGVVGGFVAERIGMKKAMVVALAVRTIGFALLALASRSPAVVLPAIFLVAAAPAIYLPANRAYTVTSAPPELTPAFISINNSALNAGMALGPLVASQVILKNPSLLFTGVGCLFAVLTASHQFGLPALAPAPATGPARFFPDLRRAASRAGRPILVNTAIFYIYFHFQSFLGLYLSETGRFSSFGWIMLVNLSVLFFVQPVLARRIASAEYARLLVAGLVLMAAGLCAYGASSVPACLIGAVVMSVGQAMLFLRADLEIVARLPEQPAMAFGIQRLCTGVGALLSGVTGGVAFDRCKSIGSPPLFWVSVAAQCLLIAGACFIAVSRQGEASETRRHRGDAEQDRSDDLLGRAAARSRGIGQELGIGPGRTKKECGGAEVRGHEVCEA